MITAILATTLFLPFATNQTGNAGYATLRGAVQTYATDSVLKPVPGAIVTATSAVDVEAVSADADGNFLFLSLLPGVYTLSAAKPGLGPTCLGPFAPNSFEFSAGLAYQAEIELATSCR